MGHLIQPRNIINKDGETQVRIVIDLNINLAAGSIEVSKCRKKMLSDEPDLEAVEEKPAWEIPNFTSSEKIKFGKNE